MNDDIKSFSALMNLERASTIFLTTRKWPSEKTEKNWDKFITYLNSLSSEEPPFENLTTKKLELLQKLFDSFISDSAHDINRIIRVGKKVLPQMISAIPKLTINKIPIDDEKNERYLLLFFNNIPKTYFRSISIPIMKYYLNSGKQSLIIKSFIRLIFSSIQTTDAAYISNIELFLSEKELRKKLKNLKAPTYNNALTKLDVAEKFKNSLYFKVHFFYWIQSLRIYNYDLIKDNYTDIKNCTEDEKKLLLAKIIIFAHDSMNGKKNDEFIKRIDADFFRKDEVDKTEKDYWILLGSEYKTAENEALLNKAHAYYVNIFTRFIITKFYDSLGKIANDRSGQARAEFWRKYGTSEAFVDIKLILNDWQRNQVFAGLNLNEIKIFNKHCIQCDNNSYSESAVFVIIFNSKIVVDYVQNNHSGQVFNSNNPYITNLLHRHFISNSKEFNYFTSGSVFNNPLGEGRIIHSGYYWQTKIDQALSQNNIYPGNDK